MATPGTQLTPDQQAAMDYYQNAVQGQSDAGINAATGGGGAAPIVPWKTPDVITQPSQPMVNQAGYAPAAYAGTPPPFSTSLPPATSENNPAMAEVGKAADETVRAQVKAANAAIGATGKPKEAAAAAAKAGGGGAGESPGPATATFGEQGILSGAGQVEKGITREQEALQRQAQLEGMKSSYVAQGNAVANQWALEAAQTTKKREDAMMAMATYRDKMLTQQANSIKDIDPSQVYGHGPWGAIVAAITQGLGAFGAGMTGGKTNFASDIIQNAIKTSVESQRANIEKQWRKVTQGTEMAHNQELRDQFTVQKERDLENTYLTLAKNRVLDQASTYDNPTIMAKAQGMAAAMDQKIGDNTKSTAIAMTDLHMKQEQLNIERAKIGQGQAGQNEAIAQKEEDDVRKTVLGLMQTYPGASYEQLYSMVKNKGLGGPPREAGNVASEADKELTQKFDDVAKGATITQGITQHIPGTEGKTWQIQKEGLATDVLAKYKAISGREPPKDLRDRIEQTIVPSPLDSAAGVAQKKTNLAQLFFEAEAEKQKISKLQKAK